MEAIVLAAALLVAYVIVLLAQRKPTMNLSQHAQDQINEAFAAKQNALDGDAVVAVDQADVEVKQTALTLAEGKVQSDTNTALGLHQIATNKAHDALQTIADELGFTLPS